MTSKFGKKFGRKRKTKFGANFGTKQGLNIGNGFVYLSLKKAGKLVFGCLHSAGFSLALKTNLAFFFRFGHWPFAPAPRYVNIYHKNVNSLHIITENAK